MYKGTNPDIDSYSAFFDNKKLSHTDMEEFLRNRGVTDVFVCGIAYDVCVGEESKRTEKPLKLHESTIF